MPKLYFATLALIALNCLTQYSVMAAVEKSANDWQIRSLKGITSLKYGVAYDPEKKLTKQLTTDLDGIKLTAKAVDLKSDRLKPLSATEARLIISVDQRGENKSWVGLYVEQKSKLDRDPSITYEAETYKIGSVCANDKLDATLKELCTQFVTDLNKK